MNGNWVLLPEIMPKFCLVSRNHNGSLLEIALKFRDLMDEQQRCSLQPDKAGLSAFPTLVKVAANDRNAPKVTNAALCLNSLFEVCRLAAFDPAQVWRATLRAV